MRVSRSRVFNRVTSASAFFCGIERYEQDSTRSAALCPRQLRLSCVALRIFKLRPLQRLVPLPLARLPVPRA